MKYMIIALCLISCSPYRVTNKDRREANRLLVYAITDMHLSMAAKKWSEEDSGRMKIFLDSCSKMFKEEAEKGELKALKLLYPKKF